VSSMSSPINRRNIPSDDATAALRSSTFGVTTCQQLTGEIGGPAGGHADLVEIGAHRIPVGGRAQRQLHVPADHAQHVVEIVGDATGQPPHRFHLLRLCELLLQPDAIGFRLFAVGDVLRAPDGAHRVAGRAVTLKEGLRAHLHPTELTVGTPDPVLDVVEPVGRRGVRARHRVGDPLPVVAMNPFDRLGIAGDAGVRRQRVVGTDAGETAQLGRPVALPRDVVVIEEADVGHANRLRQPLFTSRQPIFGVFARRDVTDDRLRRDDPPFGVAHRLDDGAVPTDLSTSLPVFLGRQRLSRVDDVTHAGPVAVGDLRWKQLVDRSPLDLRGREAERRRGCMVDVQEAARRIRREDRVEGGLHEPAVALFAFPQRLFSPHAVADVAEGGHEAGEASSGIVDTRDRSGNREALTVARNPESFPGPVAAHVQGRRVIGLDQRREVPATDVGWTLVPPEPDERAVGERDHAVDVGEDDRVHAGVDRLRNEIQTLCVGQTGRGI
jgi:hypothetical protein